jgi:hypothetical protein
MSDAIEPQNLGPPVEVRRDQHGKRHPGWTGYLGDGGSRLSLSISHLSDGLLRG